MAMAQNEIRCFQVCCAAVFNASKDVKVSNMAEAASYALIGMDMDTEEEIKAQIPYILSNTQYWQGKQARRVKGLLRELLEL